MRSLHYIGVAKIGIIFGLTKKNGEWDCRARFQIKFGMTWGAESVCESVSEGGVRAGVRGRSHSLPNLILHRQDVPVVFLRIDVGDADDHCCVELFAEVGVHHGAEGLH